MTGLLKCTAACTNVADRKLYLYFTCIVFSCIHRFAYARLRNRYIAIFNQFLVYCTLWLFKKIKKEFSFSDISQVFVSTSVLLIKILIRKFTS